MKRITASLIVATLLLGFLPATIVRAVPVADANGPYEANEGTEVIFDATESTDTDGSPLQYRWDFNNDGTWDTEYSTDPAASYTWYDDYTGTVIVEVSDAEFTDTATATVTVYNVAPTATIESVTAPDPIMPGDPIYFRGSAYDPGIEDTLTFEWDFGDGTTALGEDVDHVYTNPGIYTVTLTVTDDDGGSGSATLEYDLAIIQRATVDVNPNTLNLKSRGRWITCYIELPEGYDVADIDIGTVALSCGEDEVPAEWGDVQDGVLMVKFDRSEVADMLADSLGDAVELTVTGELADGTPFEGSDTIRVISKGKNRK